MNDAGDIRAALLAALRDNGLSGGVPLMVHSGLGAVVRAMRQLGVDASDLREQAAAMVADVLDHAAGPDGTVCVPGFFYDYARKGLTYDLRTSPPDKALGAFPDYFFRHRMTHRSLSPLVCLMTAGAQADWVVRAPSLYGNGVGSPWARLVEADGWTLFLGCSPNTMTFTHHVEQLVGVPHLYNKVYRIPVVDMDGRRHPWSICSVRFLDPRFPVTYDLDRRFVPDLERLGILVRGQWQGVEFSFARLRAVQEMLAERLTADPFYLLQSPPTFVRGVIPDDGPLPAEERG